MKDTVVVVFEKNAVVRRRIERVVRAASGMRVVRGFDLVEDGLEALSGRPLVVACNLEHVGAVEARLSELPFSSVLTWGTRESKTLLRLSRSDRRFGGFLSWPEFASMPRAAELGCAVRRLLSPASGIGAGSLLGPCAVERSFQPTRTAELEDVVAETRALALELGVGQRQAEHVAVVAHELLMNAVYVAPRAQDGLPKYAHDRKLAIELEPHEVPSFRLATDGMRLGMHVTDRFGRLERRHVHDGILRGLASPSLGAAVDTRGGGAGLGLYKVYASAAALFCDVRPGRRTDVVAVFDLDVSLRDQRNMPTTLCFFED